MKSIRHIGIILALVIFSLHSSQVQAQTKQDSHPEQRAAQDAELKAQREMLERQHEEMKEQEIHFREQQIVHEELARGTGSTRSSSRARVVYRTPGDSDYFFISSGDEGGNQSQITLRNSFKGTSDSSSGKFEVDETTRHFRLMIRGKVNSGEIRIKLLYPDGKVFKEQIINASAEVTMTQSIVIKEASSSKYYGSWTYEVKADKAQGDYTLSISTN